MDINVKYSIDDEVYIINNNKVYKDYVCNILYKITKKGNTVEYKLSHMKDTVYKEEELFSTKEELLESL